MCAICLRFTKDREGVREGNLWAISLFYTFLFVSINLMSFFPGYLI
jgi:hypothetical protein